MRKVLIIGIGAGDPDHVTVQAIKALNRADVFFVMDKGSAKGDLVRIRRDVCERYIAGRPYRFVGIEDPKRDPRAAYGDAVDDWHRRRTDIYERLLRDELDEDGCGAFLVWGDPSLYDSTLRIIDRVAAREAVAFECEVIPGITSVQALAARHRTVLNRVGAPVHITTGRGLAASGLPDDVEAGGSVVVMLDGENAFRSLAGRHDLEICWGAYVGMEDEILISGRLDEVAGPIEAERARARAAKGWIMDVYLLRKVQS